MAGAEEKVLFASRTHCQSSTGKAAWKARVTGIGERVSESALKAGGITEMIVSEVIVC